MDCDRRVELIVAEVHAGAGSSAEPTDGEGVGRATGTPPTGAARLVRELDQLEIAVGEPPSQFGQAHCLQLRPRRR
jgi:hypothetical protein